MLAQKSITGTVAAKVNDPSGWISLDAKQRCDAASCFEEELFKRVVAQDDAVLALSQLYQIYLAKMALPGRPLGTMLLLGPTGSGKTHSVHMPSLRLIVANSSIPMRFPSWSAHPRATSGTVRLPRF
jgi:ATP-dependent Clp protease ATP-binding subunit ClpA